VKRGADFAVPTPAKVTIDQLTADAFNPYVNRLIEIENAEFVNGVLGQTYASDSGTENRNFQDCNNEQMILRTSNFADFALEPLPTGNGSIVGIYAIFNDDRQMIINTNTDVNFTGDRCDGSGSGPVDLTPNITIKQLKARHMLGSIEPITEDLIFEARVVSSDQAGNFFKKIIVEDGEEGIEIRVDLEDLHQSFPIGQQVFVLCNGLALGDFNGLIQLGVQNGTSVNRIGAGQFSFFVKKGVGLATPTPVKVTIDQLTADAFNPYVNRLIEIENVEFIDGILGQTYASSNRTENRNFQDCNNEQMILRTSNFADFALEPLPTGNGSIVGIYAIFNDDRQMIINTNTDVNYTGDRCDGSGTGGGHTEPLETLTENFDDISTGQNLSLNG